MKHESDDDRRDVPLFEIHPIYDAGEWRARLFCYACILVALAIGAAILYGVWQRNN